MTKTGAYIILKEHKIVFEYYAGITSAEELMHITNSVYTDPDFDSSFYFVLDFRDATLQGNKIDMQKYLKFLQDSASSIAKRKAAYLTSKPNEVVITTIFTNLMEKLPLIPRIFTTIENALNWLDYPELERQKLIAISEELRSNPKNIL